eukprot:352374-Chlamydomonas_euryale.AAC.4
MTRTAWRRATPRRNGVAAGVAPTLPRDCVWLWCHAVCQRRPGEQPSPGPGGTAAPDQAAQRPLH